MENKEIVKENFFDLSYLKSSMTIDELMEEMDSCVQDLNKSAFESTFNVKLGVTHGYENILQVLEDIIDRLEEKSPDPENDPFITKLYNMYNAVEQLKDKCKWL